MEFLLNNDVEFEMDRNDSTYVATIKITNDKSDEDGY